MDHADDKDNVERNHKVDNIDYYNNNADNVSRHFEAN